MFVEVTRDNTKVGDRVMHIEHNVCLVFPVIVQSIRKDGSNEPLWVVTDYNNTPINAESCILYRCPDEIWEEANDLYKNFREGFKAKSLAYDVFEESNGPKLLAAAKAKAERLGLDMAGPLPSDGLQATEAQAADAHDKYVATVVAHRKHDDDYFEFAMRMILTVDAQS